jgi:glycosyltransferase involved in cell wall biosynthesis
MHELYANADVLLCVSAHEGFGIPAVEAMYFGLPIVAWGQATVPETLGEAGIVCSRIQRKGRPSATRPLPLSKRKKPAEIQSAGVRNIKTS